MEADKTYTPKIFYGLKYLTLSVLIRRYLCSKKGYKMLKKYLFTIIAVLLPTLLCAAPLTLEQCIERGMTHNPEVKAYQLAIDEAGQSVNEAWGAFLPTLSLNYNHKQLRNGGDDETDNDYLDQRSNSFNCNLSQPLFTGLSGLTGLKRARHSQEYRRVELTYMKKQLIKEISTSFYSLLYARQRAVQWEQSVERLEQQKHIASAWVEQRLAPRLHLYEIEVELSNARHELIRAAADKAVAAAQLREWLAYDPAHEVEISGDLKTESAAPCSDLDHCTQQALEQRAEIRLIELNVAMARQDVKMIRARNLPQVTLDASWTDYQRDYENSSNGDDRDYYSLSLNMNLKLFQGGRTISAWRRQKIAVDRLRQQQVNQRRTIVSETQTRFEQLKESHARIRNANDGLLQAREAYKLSAKSVELGVLSLNDLLSAELRLTRAELKLIDSRAALQLAMVRLNFAVGQ